MPTSQANQPLALVTPAWKDKLLLTGLSGQEAVSRLFQFVFEFAVENTNLAEPFKFHELLGAPLNARFRQGGTAGEPPEERFFSGVCAEFAQASSDDTFTHFQAVVVPKMWLLTRQARSRIFQQIRVPDILKQVLRPLLGADVEFKLEGQYEPRDYCTQYRETDFNFASRLMEEEGIFYFFKHTEDKHTLVVSDHAGIHAPLPRAAMLVTAVEAGHKAHVGTAVITTWHKRQELRAGKVSLWDHTFELPHDSLAASEPSQPTATAGGAAHELLYAANRDLEIYDWPGEFAQRFDGVDPSGAEQEKEPRKAQSDNKRTTKLRMEQEASGAVSVTGGGEWAQLLPGAKLEVKTLSGDTRAGRSSADGAYVLTGVSHFITSGAAYRTGDSSPAAYHNQFTAVPADLPFRPARTTPKPVVQGTQTAVVSGPEQNEIYTDKYGRIKVKFHWDRSTTKDGKRRDAASSCWIRVATPSAGRGWGSISIPRIGQEVVVDFLEGDPDQPIVIGSVFNPDQMPKYKLPDNMTRSGLRSNSTPGGAGFNEVRLEDKAGQEQMFIHAQKDQDTTVRNDSKENVGHDRHARVGFAIPSADGGAGAGAKHGNLYEEVAVDHHSKVHKDRIEHIGGDVKLLIGGIDGPGNLDLHVKKARTELIDDTYDVTVKKPKTELLEDTFDQHVKKAVTQTFDDTLDHHVKAAVTQTFDATHDQIIAGAVKQIFAATHDHVVSGAVTQTFGATHDVRVAGKQSVTVAGGVDLHVAGAKAEKVDQSVSLTIGQAFQEKAGTKHAVEAGQEIHLKAGMNVVIEAGVQLTLKGPGGFITISPAGVAIQGTMVLINSGGAAGSGSGSSPTEPKDAKEAKTAKAAKDAKDPKLPKDAEPIQPTDAANETTGGKSN